MPPSELYDVEDYFKLEFEAHKDETLCKHSAIIDDKCPKCDSDYKKPHKGVYELRKGA